MMCVEKSTVLFDAIFLSNARISINWAGSNPVVGSSKMSTSGSGIKAAASPTRCLYPFDKAPIFLCFSGPRTVCSMTRSTADFSTLYMEAT